ncbi:phosphohydrolase [Patescibacteria group bacterium]|nr:phosphohydrolase [Patescibacteria group bacterium]
MTRDQAYQTLTTLISNENLIKHHLACEAAMKAIYEYIQRRDKKLIDEQEEKDWGIVGLLHDADYELTKGHPEKHTLVLEQKIGKELPPELMYAIKAHNYKFSKANPLSNLDWAIYTCDELTGLIIAATLVHPEKKLSMVDVDFVKKRYNEKSFAKGADRNQIKLCEKSLGIKLDDFIEIVLSSMQNIAPELGLA